MNDLEIVENIERDLLKTQQERANRFLKLIDKKTRKTIKTTAQIINKHFYDNSQSIGLIELDVFQAIVKSTLTADTLFSVINKSADKLAEKYKDHNKALKKLKKFSKIAMLKTKFKNAKHTRNTAKV